MMCWLGHAWRMVRDGRGGWIHQCAQCGEREYLGAR